MDRGEDTGVRGEFRRWYRKIFERPPGVIRKIPFPKRDSRSEPLQDPVTCKRDRRRGTRPAPPALQNDERRSRLLSHQGFTTNSSGIPIALRSAATATLYP